MEALKLRVRPFFFDVVEGLGGGLGAGTDVVVDVDEIMRASASRFLSRFIPLFVRESDDKGIRSALRRVCTTAACSLEQSAPILVLLRKLPIIIDNNNTPKRRIPNEEN